MQQDADAVVDVKGRAGTGVEHPVVVADAVAVVDAAGYVVVVVGDEAMVYGAYEAAAWVVAWAAAWAAAWVAAAVAWAAAVDQWTFSWEDDVLLDVWSAPSKRVQGGAELTTDGGYNGRGPSFPEGVQYYKVVGIEFGAYFFLREK